MKPLGSHDERAVPRAHSGECEPQDPLAGTAGPIVDTWAAESGGPVRHLAHRILEALS